MIELFKLNHTLAFPSVEFALDEPNGLLAFGGDLSVSRLVMAYQKGIFPWYSEGEPILWWSPHPRAIFDTRRFQASKSLKKNIRKFKYRASLNSCFDEVIDLCAKVPRSASEKAGLDQVSTWINQDMLTAYKTLHRQSFAHSVEIFDNNNKLVGGLYGVVVSGVFCGESMFHLSSDASKAALFALVQHMKKHHLNIIDCQLVNAHLLKLGCESVSRNEFQNLLIENQKSVDCWHAQDLDFGL